MAPADQDTVARLLTRWNQGDREVAEELIPLIYDEVRAVARRSFRREHGYRTLQPTAVVHEALLRFQGSRVTVESRSHLIGLLARTMRQVLVDHARERRAEKRGGGVEPVPLDRVSLEHLPGTNARDVQILDLEEALRALGEVDPAKAHLVELRFFGGLSIEEAAGCLEVSVATANREWRKARAWLIRELDGAG